MPLVTVTCSAKCYPPDDTSTAVLGTRQQMVLNFVEELPRLMLAHARTLYLDADTAVEGVQVDIRKFHARAVNNVDLWIHVWLTEAHTAKLRRIEIRNTLAQMVQEWLATHHGGGLSWALDIFYGPGHGCLANDCGKVEFTW